MKKLIESHGTIDESANNFYVVYFFDGENKRKEVHAVGPFRDRKLATKYAKYTKGGGVDVRVTSKPPVDVDYGFVPLQYIMNELGE